MTKRIVQLSALEGYDLWSQYYDQTPNLVVALDSRHTVSLLAPASGEVVLDAGCGTGRNLHALISAECEPIGIDFSKGMLSVAANRFPDVPLARSDLHQTLPFRSASFDAVLCALIGEHLTNLRTAIQEFHRVLRPGGRLIFSAYHPAMAEAGKEANFEVSGVEYRLGAVRHSVGQYEDSIRDAGFRHLERFEFKGDRQLAREVAAAVKYLDFPVLLVLKAIRT
jgi:ubiquinone/menaquinone biosynthesis C-methylase UbiE